VVENVAAVPVPVRVVICGEVGSLSLIVSVPFLVPDAVGVNGYVRSNPIDATVPNPC